jgi:dihydrofolate reductase
MRKLIYSMTVSLDGYIAGPDGAIDWSVPDEELFLFHTQQVQEIGVHLCGRRLYETMVYWETAEESPLVAEHVKFAQIWKALPKVVFSTRWRAWWETPGWPRTASARRSRGSRNSPERTSASAAPASPVRV